MAKKAVQASADAKKKIAQGFREIKNKRPYPMQDRDERQYIVENGIDREDRKQFVNDRKGFRNKVTKMSEKNEMDMLKNKKRYKNYSLIRK